VCGRASGPKLGAAKKKTDVPPQGKSLSKFQEATIGGVQEGDNRGAAPRETPGVVGKKSFSQREGHLSGRSKSGLGGKQERRTAGREGTKRRKNRGPSKKRTAPPEPEFWVLIRTKEKSWRVTH